MHGGLSRSRRLNRWLGVVAGLPVGVPYSLFRAFHLAHHRTAGTADDPTVDNPHRLPQSFWRYLVYLVGGCLFFIPLMQVELLRAMPETLRRKRDKVNSFADLLVCVGVWTAVIAVVPGTFGWRPLLVYWLAVLLGSADAWIVGLAEHAGCPEDRDQAKASRTTYSSRWHRHFLSNRNYHTAHHLYPWVPSAHLPELTELLRARGRVPVEERSYVSAHWNILRRLWRERQARAARPRPA